MKKCVLPGIIILFAIITAQGQNFGIGTSTPANKLHVKTTANPVKFEGLQSVGTGIDSVIVVDPATGVLKYQKLGSAAKADSANFWQITGNAGTTPPTATGTAIGINNYWGTTDAKNLAVGTNSVTRAIFDQNGSLYGGSGTYTNTVNPTNSLVWGLNNLDSSNSSLVFGSSNILGAGVTGTSQTNRGTIVGGGNNTVKANTAAGGASYNSIVMGSANQLLDACFESTVNGFQNTIISSQKVLVNGQFNFLNGATYSTVQGFGNVVTGSNSLVQGISNITSGSYGLVVGATNLVNAGSNYTVALGQGNTIAANHSNSFVLGTNATSTAAGQLTARFTGGYVFNTNASPAMVMLPSGNVGIGTAAPATLLEVNSGTAGASGQRFTQLNSSSTPVTTGIALLGVNSTGDVVAATSTTGNTTTNTSNGLYVIKRFTVPDAPGTQNSGAGFATGFSSTTWDAVLSGWHVTGSGTALATSNAVIGLYLSDNGGTWRIKGDVAATSENWIVDVFFIKKSLGASDARP